MQSATKLASEIEIANQEKKATRIVISQISLLITKLANENFTSVEDQINYLLEKSSLHTYFKYWRKLLAYCAIDILEKHQLSADNNLPHRLLRNLLNTLPLKNQEFIERLSKETFDSPLFQQDTGLTLDDIVRILDPIKDKDIIESFKPSLLLTSLEKLKTTKMNNFKVLQTFILQESPSSMEAKLNDVFLSLNGETLNDMVALLLSEILSPGSQKLQDNFENSWFTPNTIPESSEIAEHISNSFKKVAPNTLNWNRIFNLMSTKYFMTTPLKPSTASLNCLLASLKSGSLIDQFFSCDWDINFKLFVTCELHKWPSDAFDLLSVSDTKKVSDKIPNNKNSLLYLLCVATLDLELFLLRDELVNNPMLTYYQECFFEDFSYSPENLYLALVGNIKHFTLLIENKSVIDEIIVTLFVQVFVKSPEVLGDLLAVLPSKEKILIDITRIILDRKDVPIDNFTKVLVEQDKLNFLLGRISFSEAFGILPTGITFGWTGFNDFMKSNLNVDNAIVALDAIEQQIKLKDSNIDFRSCKFFDLPSLYHLIMSLMDVPFNSTDLERFEKLQYDILITFPKIINIGNGHDDIVLKNGGFTPISSDVETEMQGYLQKMYSGEMPIKDVVEILRKLKDSGEPRDQEVFACITHAVLGECSFFKDYPLEALATTSVLFGSMILFHLLNGFVLDVALRTILNFAKEGPESKMFKFAIQAIYAFRIRLVDFPQYCKDLLTQIPGLQTQTQVYQFILSASKNADNVSSDDKARNKPVVTLIPLRYFVVDEWHSAVVQENPPKEITEKVLFIANNITIDNFSIKIPDLVSILTPNYYSWFANYLVNQRAKTEPNYHALYCKIMMAFKSNPLQECIINITLRQLYVVLATKDKNQIDKKILKNLSTWLGHITLGVDRPIRHRNVAFRELLLNAYKEDRLDIIVPFVSKVIQNVSDSKVFRPPNPWTVGILKLLLELNEKADWKLSLTFEVEVLFKTLNISIKSIEPSNFIEKPDIIDLLAGNLGSMSLEQQQTEHQRQVMLMQQHQQHMLIYRQRQQRMLSSGVNDRGQFGIDSLKNSASGLDGANNPNPTAANGVQNNDTPFNNLLGSTIFVTHPDLKRVFQMALAKTVREILIPAVEKACNIALVTTIKVVTKDFATEVDEIKLNTAALNMVRHLAQSLARATSLEPLREGIRSTTQSLAPNLMTLSSNPFVELDKAINDNIGLALALVENAAIERATQEIGEQLMQSVAVRRYHQERRADQPFLAPNVNPYSLTLPEPLGLKSAGITQQQFKIYEEFGTFMPPMDNIPNVNGAVQPPVLKPQAPVSKIQEQFQQPQQPNLLQQQPVTIEQPNLGQATNAVQNELEQNHRVLVHLMDVLVAQIKENADKESLKDLGEQNQINNIIFQILTFIARSEQKDQLALKVSQAVVNSLFATSDSSLCREVLSLLLEKLCSLSMVARKDVSWWLIYALDSRKFNVRVIRSLLEVNLINVAELDNVLVTAMKKNMENSVEFAIEILKDTVLSTQPLLMRMDFICTLEYLTTLDDLTVKNFLEEYNKSKVLPVSKGTNIVVTEKYFLVFTEWVKLLQKVNMDDKVVLAFISQMLKNGVISDTDSLIEFIKAALELSVFAFKESDPTGEVFTAIDALGKLIVKLLIFQDFSDWSNAEYMNVIFSVILLVFSKDHQQTTFNERPYFRLLSNILFEWGNIRGQNFAVIKNSKTRSEFRDFDVDFYNIFATYLHSFQPFAFPGFSFAWVSLISHRMFLPVMLRLNERQGWEKIMILIIDLFKFLDTYTTKDSSSDAISVVYKGTLRVLLGISNDLPEFLIANHYELMNNIPATYLQLKNVILSAIPSKTMVPNPYDHNLYMANIELCQVPPPVFYDPVNDLKSLKKPVDNYLRIPSNSLFKTILNGVYRNEYDVKNGIGYDFFSVDNKLVRAIVLHIGIEAGLENERTSSNAVFNTKSSYYALLFNLINEGITELKFQVLQVMIEQLRYPNIHTYWISYVLLNMFTSNDFGEQTSEVQEIMLRCLLERIVVNKPHAWGVSVLFTRFLTDDKVNLLDLDFVKTVPQVENILKQLKQHTSDKNLEKNKTDSKHNAVSANAS